MADRKKVIEGLERCFKQNESCKDCPYVMGDSAECLDHLIGDALLVLRQEDVPAHVVDRDTLLASIGEGWEESWFKANDESPETKVLTPCVWISGHIMTRDGCHADAHSDYWAERYNRKFGMRIWGGDLPPTEKQREAVKWE